MKIVLNKSDLDDWYVIERALIRAVAHKIETLRAMIANDAHACTFQSFGQYRSALLAALSNTPMTGPERVCSMNELGCGPG
jgi:hypothetical protein